VIDDAAVEVAQLQCVLQRIQQRLSDVPLAQREYIAAALLNVAVARMLTEEGRTQMAGILLRPGDVQSSPDRLADLRRMDG
jgi:hypothetical protein